VSATIRLHQEVTDDRRLINHSCDPSASAKIISINGQSKVGPMYLSRAALTPDCHLCQEDIASRTGDPVRLQVSSRVRSVVAGAVFVRRCHLQRLAQLGVRSCRPIAVVLSGGGNVRMRQLDSRKTTGLLEPGNSHASISCL
jgi:hypothetical protein